MSERTTITKTVSLPPEVAAQLKDAAEEDGLPESLIVRWALERFFAAAKRKKQHARRSKS